MTKTKFAAFLTMGVLALSLVTGVYQNISTSNMQYQQEQVTQCEDVKGIAIRNLDFKMYRQDALNEPSILAASNKADLINAQIKELSPNQVNCNIKSMRVSFLKGYSKAVSPKPNIGYTPG